MNIIRGYYTLINGFLLNYISFRVYFTFQNITQDIEEDIVKYFDKDKSVYFIASIEGEFNLVITKWVRRLEDLYPFFENLMKKYRKYIKSYILTPYKATIFEKKKSC